MKLPGTIEPTKSVGTEDVALCLDQIGTAACLSQAVIPAEARGQRRDRQAQRYRAADNFAQSQYRRREPFKDGFRQDQLPMWRRAVEG